MGRLHILTEGFDPSVLELAPGVTTLGRREGNPLCVPDDSVSGRHCDLAEADGLLTILDLGSTNGTFIKGEQVETGTVTSGETFRLGSVEIRYEAETVTASSPVLPSAPPPAQEPVLAVPTVATPAPAPVSPVVAEPPKPEAPKLPSLPKLVVPARPQPAPAVPAPASGPAVAPAAPKLNPAEALKQSLAKAPVMSAPAAPAPLPAPAPAVKPPAVSPPTPSPAGPSLVKPGSVKPPEPGTVPKLSLGGHKPPESAPAAAPAPAPPTPKPGGSKVVPTGEPSKFSLSGHGKSPAAPAPAASASAVVPTGGPPKYSLGGHKPAPAAAPAEAAPAPSAVTASAPPPPAAKGGKPCKRHPAHSVQYVCKKCKEQCCDKCAPPTEVSRKIQHFCPVCKNLCLTLADKAALDSKALIREGQTFKQRLPGVFKYPFNKNGIMFLIIGTIVFVALDFASRFSMKIAIVGIGYLFAYMQKIVRSSAEAEDELPGFPEVSEWRTELLQPFLLLAWTFIVSFGPAFGYMIYHTVADTEMSLTVLFPLFALGFLYFPMALLAVAMSSSYLAVNPLVVLPAIAQLNLEYVGATAVFFGLVIARYLSETLLRAAVPVPVLPTLIGGFLALYFLACEMRLLGLIYYEHKRKLGWFSH